MNHFSEELRKEREARNITLFDISQKTRISIKYLQAIDQGAFDILPQTYVRAFIKAYAEAIGMDPSQILKKYEIHSTPEHKEETASVRDEGKFTMRPETTEHELKREKRSRSFVALAVIALAVGAASYIIFNYFNTVIPANSVKETILYVSRHIVVAFIVMPIIRGFFRYKFIEVTFQILAYCRISIFINC